MFVGRKSNALALSVGERERDALVVESSSGFGCRRAALAFGRKRVLFLAGNPVFDGKRFGGFTHYLLRERA